MNRHLAQNPTNGRLSYIWEHDKPEPTVMMDVLLDVGSRIGVDWVSRVQKAANVDPAFLAAWTEWDLDSDNADRDFVTAVLAMVGDMPEFKKKNPIDRGVQWFVRQMNGLYLEAKDAPLGSSKRRASQDRYQRLRILLGTDDPLFVEWVEKKKPNLTKMTFEEVAEAMRAFDEDREPEVVYTWRDGYKIVKLATRTQIQKEGAALGNCLRKGSSHSDDYCNKALAGTSEFFSLRDPNGDSLVSIQWSPGNNEPEQVYAADNEEPDEDEARRVGEWAKSRGGVYSRARFSRLSREQRDLAELMAEECPSEDDESIEMYAMEWDEAFTPRDAKSWIRTVGCSAYDVAKVLSEHDFDNTDWEKLFAPVREWTWGLYPGLLKSFLVSEVLHAGLLAGMMAGTSREERPGASWPKHQARLPFEEKVYEQKPPAAPPPVAPMPHHRLNFEKPEDAALYAEAMHWVKSGWDDKDNYDDAAAWWAAWFSPTDALIFQDEIGQYERDVLSIRGSNGMSIEMAKELRRKGISAQDVIDAIDAAPEDFDTRNLDKVVGAVEAMKLKRNRRKARR